MDAQVSLEEVAVVVGVTRQAVGNWERGTRTPRGDDLNRYLAVLDQLRGVTAT